MLSASSMQASSLHKPIILEVIKTPITIHHKSSQVFDIIDDHGHRGYEGEKGQDFDVILKNRTPVPITIHWHGLILPNDQDGVAFVTQLPIPPGKSQHYHFPLLQSGTYWMHSHYKLYEQELQAAPLIIHDANDPYQQYKSITILLQDFSFTNPEKIFAGLKSSPMKMPHASGAGSTMKMPVDLNDVNYDAFLANRKTLDDPDIIAVTPNETVRLRIINASAASNYWIHTDPLIGQLIAVDGQLIQPIKDSSFQIAIAQRLDILLTIPGHQQTAKQHNNNNTEQTYPVLAQVEGTRKQSGVLLVTSQTHANSSVQKFNFLAANNSPPMNDEQELKLHPLQSIKEKPKPITKVLHYSLEGNMQQYIWTINNQAWPHVTPLIINKGDQVAMVFNNQTSMSHPMHLHGHIFQVTEINGKPIQNGPWHDTILVLPHTTKTIVFTANNPGIWPMHCHVLYHQEAGMMTTTNYKDYPEPSFYRKLISNSVP